MNRTQCDQPAHRFFHRIAQRLVELAQPKPGDTVLEIAASLEAVTLYTAPPQSGRQVKSPRWISLKLLERSFPLSPQPLVVSSAPSLLSCCPTWRLRSVNGGASSNRVGRWHFLAMGVKPCSRFCRSLQPLYGVMAYSSLHLSTPLRGSSIPSLNSTAICCVVLVSLSLTCAVSNLAIILPSQRSGGIFSGAVALARR